MNEPEYYTAATLATRVGVSLRTFQLHMQRNVGLIRDAKVKVPGLRGHRFPIRGCRKYIELVTAGRAPA